jgi:hypothetical protein
MGPQRRGRAKTKFKMVFVKGIFENVQYTGEKLRVQKPAPTPRSKCLCLLSSETIIKGKPKIAGCGGGCIVSVNK